MDLNPSQPGCADRKKTECRAGLSHGRGDFHDIFLAPVRLSNKVGLEYEVSLSDVIQPINHV